MAWENHSLCILSVVYYLYNQPSFNYSLDKINYSPSPQASFSLQLITIITKGIRGYRANQKKKSHIKDKPKFDAILHWLPIRQRIGLNDSVSNYSCSYMKICLCYFDDMSSPSPSGSTCQIVYQYALLEIFDFQMIFFVFYYILSPNILFFHIC